LIVTDAKTWVEEQLAAIIDIMPQDFITFRLFVTESSASASHEEKLDKLEQEIDSSNTR